jgi:hypothetical protein
LFLILSAALASRHFLAGVEVRNTDSLRRKEIILTCATLHVGFVILFFGNQFSWIYYSYLLVVGVAAAADMNALSRRLTLVLCLMGLLSWTDIVIWLHHYWQIRSPHQTTDGLWASKEQRVEWANVRGLMEGYRTVLLDTSGAAELMFPGFEPPVSAYLEPGLMIPAEMNRKLRQMSSADLVIVPIGTTICSPMPISLKFDAAMKEFLPLRKGRFFTVFKKRIAHKGP